MQDPTAGEFPDRSFPAVLSKYSILNYECAFYPNSEAQGNNQSVAT